MEPQADPAIISEPVLRSLTNLCRQYRVRSLALFGSATGTSFDPGTSDLDLLVTFEPMPPAEHMEHFFRLLEGLEALFCRRIDLVEPAAIRNPFVLASVLQGRVELYAAA
jgi:predicted nucleotidyltransferase